MTLPLPQTDRATLLPPSARPAFSSLQLLHASRIGDITPRHRATFPVVPAYAIDDLDPLIRADRDDGIYVKKASNEGGYNAFVTIANIPNHVQLNSALVQTAILRRETIYDPRHPDSMFPKDFEGKLSLEHQEERLGFAFCMDLDARFLTQHFEFQPVMTCAVAISYAEATEKMKTDSQLNLIGWVAAGLRKNHFGWVDNKHCVREEVFSYTPFSDALPSADKVVEIYMKYANTYAAKFVHASGLPYLYRNSNSSGGIAYYEPRINGNDEIYGHVTSPIRRGADIVNMYVLNFAFDALSAAEQHIMGRYSGLNRPMLHKAIWRHGPEILRIYSQPTHKQTSTEIIKQTQNVAAGFLQNEVGLDEVRAKSTARTLTSILSDLKPPLSHEDMAEYAAQLNAPSRVQHSRAIKKLAESQAELNNINDANLSTMEKNAFSALLRRAAILGDIPRGLFDETLKRITEKRHNAVQDGFTILIQAPYPDVPRWNMLKRAILRQLKHAPSTVDGIIKKCQAELRPDNIIHQISKRLSDAPDSLPSALNSPDIHISIITCTTGEQIYAPDFTSAGHNERAAKSHARLAFLSAYAFGKLQPLEQTCIPNLLYAELESEGNSKRILVEKMVAEAGGNINYRAITTDLGCTFRINVSGGKFSSDIFIEAEKEKAEAAEHSALSRLLRNPCFKHAVAPIQHISALINPQNVLVGIAQGQGYDIDFVTPSPLPEGGFSAKISISKGDKKKIITKSGPNKDQAVRMATAAALNALGQSLDDLDVQNVRSWAMESTEPNPHPITPKRHTTNHAPTRTYAFN